MPALRALLAKPTGDDASPTFAEKWGVADFRTTSTEEMTSALGDLLGELRDHKDQAAFITGDGIESIDACRIYDGDGGCEGVYVFVDLAPGVRLSSLAQDHRQLTGRIETPIEAIVEAVAVVARQANAVVTRYRQAVELEVALAMTGLAFVEEGSPDHKFVAFTEEFVTDRCKECAGRRDEAMHTG